MPTSRSSVIPFDPAVERYVSLATYRGNGAEVRTPVWIAGTADHYYVFSAGDAGKIKRIRNTSRVRLAACNFGGTVHSDWVDAEARVLANPAAVATALRALRAKYGWQMYLSDFFATLSGRMRRRAYIEIILGKTTA